MDVIKKWVWGAVGVLLIIGIIVWVTSNAGKGESIADDAMNQLDTVLEPYTNVQLSKFDNEVVKGSEIVSLIKTMKADCEFTVTVINGSGSTTTYNAANTTVFEANKISMEDKNSTSIFINPYADFHAVIGRDANDVVSTVTFTQQ